MLSGHRRRKNLVATRNRTTIYRCRARRKVDWFSDGDWFVIPVVCYPLVICRRLIIDLHDIWVGFSRALSCQIPFPARYYLIKFLVVTVVSLSLSLVGTIIMAVFVDPHSVRICELWETICGASKCGWPSSPLIGRRKSCPHTFGLVTLYFLHRHLSRGDRAPFGHAVSTVYWPTFIFNVRYAASLEMVFVLYPPFWHLSAVGVLPGTFDRVLCLNGNLAGPQ